ncbi:hypothetical protein OWR28_15815 [Chryseobacterium sp. 1B4]
MFKIFCLASFLAVSSMVNAQKITKENVTGFWRLKEAGFYEGKRK